VGSGRGDFFLVAAGTTGHVGANEREGVSGFVRRDPPELFTIMSRVIHFSTEGSTLVLWFVIFGRLYG
jgi:hypothetical protein